MKNKKKRVRDFGPSQFDALLDTHEKILSEELSKKEHADENKIKVAKSEISRIEKLIEEEQENIYVKRGQDLGFGEVLKVGLGVDSLKEIEDGQE